ncbi:MAG: hypothetical protein WCT54_00945 [Patescibacteria group bacterium]|jgi:DNA-directed RNA polymerase specialized sigma24 family protein
MDVNSNLVCIHCNQPGSTAEEIVIDGNGNPTHEMCRKVARESTFKQWDFVVLINAFLDILRGTPQLNEAFADDMPDWEHFENFPRCIAAALPKAEQLGVSRQATNKLNEIRRAMIELCAS